MMEKQIKKFLNDFNIISKHYKVLIEKTKKHENVGILNEWIIDNYYVLAEYQNGIKNLDSDISKNLKKSHKIESLLSDIVSKYDYNISYKLLLKEINSYQRKNNYPFSYQELSVVPNLLLFIYTNKLKEICLENKRHLEIHDDIKKKIKSLNEIENINIKTFLSKDFQIQNNYYYIFEMNNQLREFGSQSSELFKELNEFLKEKNISLKNILNEIYQKRVDDTLLISNLFKNLKDFSEYSFDSLFIHTSWCEKQLMNDSIYANMTTETKILYRNQITKKAKKQKCSEYDYVRKLFDTNKKVKDYHIGFDLFKKKSKTFLVVIYLMIVTIFSVLISLFLSKYFISNRIIGFIILIIPTIQLVMQITNQFIIRFIPTKPLPKMNFSKGVPEEFATMIVIPTIVSDCEKIQEIYEKLETFYLINQSDNLYFTLLGDVKASDKEKEDYDQEIVDYGLQMVEKLNKKYKKELFHFIYRKRVWNKSEECFLGYERKRGALLQLNQILLHKMTKKEMDSAFLVNTLEKFDVNIKYVMPLDTDTEPVLNSFIKLVGCMAHPLNKPVVDKKKHKVIQGYGILQPRVSTDLEATNKSIYSQVFAGIGGFDTYSAIVPNAYQDLFLEGSFVGKGIYDLEVFNQILYDRFPDNLILSHDLLEGNYLRCGYVSDVEFIDGFPSKFLVDTSRQHRWARGDVQIVSYLFPKVLNKKGKKEKNPNTLLGKFKIFDNLVRMFLYPTLLLILLFTFSIASHKLVWLLFVLLVISFPVIIFLFNKLSFKKGKTVYYRNLVFGGKSLLIRSYIVFATIPYYAYLYIDAFCRAFYRLTISHKKLLNWITAEEVEKTAKFDIATYLSNFKFNLIVALVFIVYGIISFNVITIICGIIFLSAPFIVYHVSKDLKVEHTLKQEKNEKLEEVAKKTWNYFEENLSSEYNYLIPDNYQENREEKLDHRTSPTNIGYSLTSVIAAYELNFIDKAKAIFYLDEILKTIDSLDKWNGHLYNWYDIKTKKALPPYFISTVDSGNLIAALFVVCEFLRKNEETPLLELCEKLIRNANFKKLYTKKEVLSIGYDTMENRLSIYNYNKFASESRLTSYIAICKGDIPSKHWFCLDKSLTTYKKKKGLISWSGTSFEYYMPFLFMKNYPNTLLDESYDFAYFAQKSYMETIDKKLPFGISESAYNELDNALNYKYHSFSVPYLKAKEEIDDRIVISPYSSLMMTELYPEDIYQNIVKFEHLNMLSKYGFYEAYDCSNQGIVRACFAHHQGMSLMGLTNYLKDGVLKNYFHENIKIKTFEILLKEKVQVRANIDMKMAKYKKYNYEKEKIENDIRVFSYISDMPEVSVLSNQKYCLLMNDRGNGFSRYRTLQLNRYRKVTEQDYGMFLYIKDLDTQKIWSNTYAPVNVEPDQYEVVFASDKIKYLRKDGLINTKTEIIVTSNHNAEIRKITFQNNSETTKRLQLTSYTEPILSENTADVSHRVFNAMFLSSTYLEKDDTLVMKRSSRTGGASSYMMNRLIIENPLDAYSYETDRFQFVGRGYTYQNPSALEKKLTNHIGSNIEPVMALRNTIEIEPLKEVSVYLLCGFGRSMEQINDIINSYSNARQIDKAFQVANLSSIIQTKNLHITGEDMSLFNTMLNYLYQTTKITVNDERRELLKKNALSQSSLWKFGISGDRPIILVNIKDITTLPFVREILKAFEYFKKKSIFVDIIIINSEDIASASYIQKEIEDELYHMYTLNSFYHTPGIVKVIDHRDITKEEMSLLRIVPRLTFDISDEASLKEEIKKLQSYNKINQFIMPVYQNNIKMKKKQNLDFDNGYGGFQNNGEEYVIYNKNTKTPWSNVIANKNFGTIITNNGCGYTFAYNSGEYKITSWTNEMILNDKSEGIKINGEIFDPDCCTHGFGYSILESETESINTKVTEYVANNENIKIYLVTLTNKERKRKELDISYYLNPTLGNFEEKTSRHILSEFMTAGNYLKLRNVYSIGFSDVNVFMSSSERITSATIDRILIKEITTKVSLDSLGTKTIAFLLGCNKKEQDNLALIEKYKNIENCQIELENVKTNWHEKLKQIEIKTYDASFDYVMNGWYLYQSLSSRIMARAGFYQVSGAFGYRDQLQDAMNIAVVNPKYSRRQILINAAHQFRKGDVLHWWHESNHFGLRSRYKDDYLWLVYATIHYLKVTEDYDILKELIPFIEAEELTSHEKERGMNFHYSTEQTSLLEHCLLSIKYATSQMGSHELPLMGGGDWNDGMNMVGIKGKGESIWLGFFLYQIIEEFIPIIEKYGDNLSVNIDKLKKFNSNLKEHLNQDGFDKDYYLRAYFDNGDLLGSHKNEECKIDLISQSFSILSDVAPKNKIPKILNAVEENLVDKENKIIKLLTPAFKNSLNNPGYIQSYPEGIRENGGQYTHATSWYIMALIKDKKYDKAYQYYQMINPINRSRTKEDVDVYQVEPYVIAADIYSNPDFMARGGWTWYTGSAAWYYRVGLEEILGFKKRGDILIIDPNSPSYFKKYQINYHYEEAIYQITVHSSTKNEIIVNGKKEKEIKLYKTGKYKVDVYQKRSE